MYRFVLSVIALVILFSSCRKEKTSWDSNWSAPLVHGQLTINDLIPEKHTETNSDGYLSLVFHETAYSFTIDTIVDLPDTTVVEKLTLGPGTITVNPGYSFTDSYENDYNLGAIELKRVIAKQGKATIRIESPWQGKSKVTITFTKIKEDGVPFARTYFLEAGSVSAPEIQSDEIDMTNFDFDLTGLTGLSWNEVPTSFLVESDDPSSYTVEPTDSVKLFVSFTDLLPKYAKGYFGSYTFTDTIGFDLAPMKKIIGGSIDVDSIDFTLTIKNGFNLIAQSTITKVTGINTRTATEIDLSFPQLNNSININPASGGLYDMVPSEYPIPINNINSNIAAFAENLSDSLALGYELKINPFGNTSGGDDELFPTSSFDLYVDAEFPLDFGANELTLVDTFDINYNPVDDVAPLNGEIIMDYENGFPFGAKATFYLLNAENVVLDSITSSSSVTSGSYDIVSYLTTASSGKVTYGIPKSTVDLLEITDKIMLKVAFSSDETGKVKIDANSFFNFLVRTNLEINLAL